MKKKAAPIPIVLTLILLACSIILKSVNNHNLDTVGQPKTEALSDDEIPGDCVICRCHTSENTCYGGNFISLRPKCYEGHLISCQDNSACPE